MRNSSSKKPKVGKFILDSISIGMYNHPLMLFREYIQNSADAIDELSNNRNSLRENATIEVNIDGRTRSITIKDNGCGVPSHKAWNTLHDIGKSSKRLNHNRGFRGIGRLGGLAYCEELKFITKAKGENIYSVSTWNCNKLRKSINEEGKSLDVRSLVKEAVKFSQYKSDKRLEDHFFIVEMHDVESPRDILLNVPAVKAYASQVAPVPFNFSKFSYAQKIEDELKRKVPSYAIYNIYVNGEQIFKPYADVVTINGRISDRIKGIEFVDLASNGTSKAFGWVAQLKLLGKINSSGFVDGIRLRSGNIQIGDKSVLSSFFRERRFNDYLVGETHIVNHQLRLNSRRDDFEDNDNKEAFYDCFVKEIGLPFSRKIRDASASRSKQKIYVRQDNLVKMARKVHKNGYFSDIQKERIISELERMKDGGQDGSDNETIEFWTRKVANSKHFLDRKHKTFPPQINMMLSPIFDIVYKRCSDTNEAESIASNIVKKIDKIHKFKN